jgi:hypothetical protein
MTMPSSSPSSVCTFTNATTVISLAMAVERAQFKPAPVELLAWL